MPHLVFIVLGFVFSAVGYWQYRHPEKTQAIALRGSKFSWQRRLFGSDNYVVLAGFNGFLFMIIGFILLFFTLADLVIGVLL